MAKKPEKEPSKRRNFPFHTLEDALPVAQKVADERGGQPFKRLLLSDALGIKPSSSNYRDLLSSSFKYGLTDGTEKASEILLTELGARATQTTSPTDRMKALREAAIKPDVFKRFYTAYRERKLPSTEMFPKILNADFGVPLEHAGECARFIEQNGRFVQIVRDIGGSPHVLLDLEAVTDTTTQSNGKEDEPEVMPDTPPLDADVPHPPAPGASPSTPPPPENDSAPKPIFIGHGKDKVPLQKLQAILTTFRIPHRVTVDEANLGRPISQKVKDTMMQCGSAILIFTRDERFFDENQQEIWRPSENVVHELGAASFAYGDRIMIFKEKGLHFPTNFQNIGYIEFEGQNLESKTADLLKELIGFGLVKITPA
ncbi:MAG: hypothetical protein QOH88_437 [Verrucomicrobiota bacterium]|jgi:hypothetical protein